MSDAMDGIYQEIIRDHYKKPKRRRLLDGIPVAENPSCGDKVGVSITVGEDGRIADAAFDGTGCSISMSSADILAEDLIGKTPDEARARIERFLAVLRGESETDGLDELGDAAAFKGIARLPVRVKCAALAWRAALRTLDEASDQRVDGDGNVAPAERRDGTKDLR